MSPSYVVWYTPRSRLIIWPSASDALDDLAAEEPVRPDHQGKDHEDVGQEVFGAPAHVGIDVAGGHALDTADDEPAHDGAGDAVEATQYDSREDLEPDQGEPGVHAQHAAPHDAADGGRQPGAGPREREHEANVDAHRHRRLLVIGHRSHGDSHPASAEEPCEGDQEGARDEGRQQVDGRDVDLPDHVRLEADRERDVLGLCAPEHGRRSLEDLGEPDGDHDHRDDGLPHHRSQHATLEHEPQPDHGAEQDRQRDGQRQVVEAHQRRGDVAAEHHQLTLGEVHHAGGLVDQDESESDQRIHGPDHQSVHEEVEEERHGYTAASSRASPTWRMASSVRTVAWRPSWYVISEV